MFGSILITLATMLGAFAIVKSSEYGLFSARTLGIGGASLALLAGFLALESRLANPIMPLRILRQRMLMGSSFVRGLLITGMFSAFFLGALVSGAGARLRRDRHWPGVPAADVLDRGDVDGALGQSDAALRRFADADGRLGGDHRRACSCLPSQGLHASYFPGLFFAFLTLGLGAGASFLPLLTMGMSDSPARDAGLASGIINVSVQLFGAIGLATLGTIATDHTKALGAGGDSLASALTGGYHLAYLVAAGCVGLGIVAASLVLRPPKVAQPETVSGEEFEAGANAELVAA